MWYMDVKQNLNGWLGCKTMGFDWDLNVDEGYDGLGTLRHTLRSMRANKKQGIDSPKVDGRI